MPPHNWPAKVAFAVGAIFFGGGDLLFVEGGYSASILLLVGVLLFLEALSDRELTRSRRNSKPSSQFDAGSGSVGHSKGSALTEDDELKPIVDKRTVVQQISDAASAIERANRLLSHPDVSTEKRAAAQRAKAGFEVILRAKIARLLAHDGSPPATAIQPSGSASPPSISTRR